MARDHSFIMGEQCHVLIDGVTAAKFKLILRASSDFSRKLALPKITHHMISFTSRNQTKTRDSYYVHLFNPETSMCSADALQALTKSG